MKKILAFFKDGKFEEILGCIAIGVVIIPVILNIFNRSFLDSYSLNLEGAALLAYVWIGYGFFGYMYRKDSHVDVKFIVEKAGPRLRSILELLRDIYIFLFSLIMVYWGWKLLIPNMSRMITGTKIPMAIGYAGIVFGYFSGALRSGWALISRLIKRKEETAA